MLAGNIANTKLVNSSINIAGQTVSLGGSLTASTLKTALALGSAAYENTSAFATAGHTHNWSAIIGTPSVAMKKTFTFPVGETNIVLYNNDFTTDCLVIQIIITSGETALVSPITTSCTTGSITLSMTTAAEQIISGYLIALPGKDLDATI